MCKPGTASLPGDCAGVWRWVPQRTCCAPFSVIARLDRAIQYPTTVRESPNLCLQRWGYWIARLKRAMTTMGADQPQRPFGLDPSPWRPLMQENFRQFLDRLRQNGELVDLHQPVDIRHIATLVDQAKTALFFHNVIGYDMPVVSGIIRSRERPMITAGVVITRDPEFGINSGIYRFIVKERNLTGIDIVTPNNMRMFAQRAYQQGRPLPISISIGTHPIEITGSGYRAPLGMDEMAIAGGLRGAPVELAPCQTIDLPYLADAEIVLEAEILPTGWTWPEGRFGEFTRLMGGLHWNPLVRIKAISMRRDAIYYNLHMPWENTWLAAPTRYAAIRQALKTAGVIVKD